MAKKQKRGKGVSAHVVLPYPGLDQVSLKRDCDVPELVTVTCICQSHLERQPDLTPGHALEVDEARDPSTVLQHAFGKCRGESVLRRHSLTRVRVVLPATGRRFPLVRHRDVMVTG